MQYQVKDPQGQLHVIDGPEGATPDEVMAQAQKLVPSSPAPQQPSLMDKASNVGNSILSAVNPELSTALDVYNSPVGQKLQDLSAVPYQGLRGLAEGAATVVPALRSGDASQLPSPQEALQKASEATQPDYKPQTTTEKVADAVAQIIEPRSLLAGKLLEMVSPAVGKGTEELGKQASKIQEALTGVDAQNFQKLANNPMEILSAPSSKETGKAFQVAKEAAGFTDEQERKLALNDGVRKKVYQSVMEKIDSGPTAAPEDIQKAAQDFGKKYGGVSSHMPTILENVSQLHAKDPTKAAQYLDNLVTHLVPSGDGEIPGILVNKFGEEGPKSSFPFPDEATANQYKNEVLQKLQEHPTLKGIPDVSAFDLLRAKKAGQLMAKSDPAAAGLIQKEIHDKINPLLQQVAPDVYQAQQAVHLSKVKESLLSLAPEGPGLLKFLRVAGMMTGVGALDSPLVQTGLTLGVKGAAKVLGSAPARYMAGAALNRLGQDAKNRAALQSVRDRLNPQP